MAGKKQTSSSKPSKSSGGGGRLILLMVVIGAIAPFGAPTLVVCLGLLPTLVALITDTDPRRSGVITIGLLNVAGVVPFVIELWEKGQTMEAAFNIMSQPMTWLVMLGAAAIGQLILYAIPSFITLLTVNRMENRLRVLRQGLEELKIIWGPDVATSKPIDLIRGKE